ncbi:MAG: class I SAM-dependent methyltransferase [Candidatus Nanoarchaeia archaeon]
MTSYSDEGRKNLEIAERANKFVLWMYDEIKPFLKGNVIEIGSGRGTFSEYLAKDFDSITLCDIDSKYVNSLKERYKCPVYRMDISNEEDCKKIKSKADSAFSLNVFEHIEDDVKAMNNVYSLLNDGGTFVILVPAHQFLYNSMDKVIGHHRRYSKKMLLNKVAQTPFKVKKIFYFNVLSILGWYINGNILKKRTVNESAMGILNKIVPCLKFVEKYILRKTMGLSVIAVLEK